jgi:hypothetical protein
MPDDINMTDVNSSPQVMDEDGYYDESDESEEDDDDECVS